MAVTVSQYDHTNKLLLNKEIDFTTLKVILLSNAASFTRTHTTIAQAANGASATVTISIATPGVVTQNGHGKANGDPVTPRTTGALPTGLAANTVYYAKNVTTNTYELAATPGGASINTTGSQSGVHTMWAKSGHEVYGNGWAPFGETIANIAITQVALGGDSINNDAKLTGDDLVKTASGGSLPPTAAYAEIIYDFTTMKPLWYVDYGQAQQAGDTTDFKSRWNATGGIYNVQSA